MNAPAAPVVRLTAVGASAAEAGGRTARVRVSIGGEPVALEITVPAGPVPLADVLPVFQGWTDLVVEMATRQAARAGQGVSCRKGCGACCRQAAPIAMAEARALRVLVDGLPAARRARIEGRFQEASARLAAAGLREPFLHPTAEVAARRQELGLAYFRLGIPCPFLEDECCSIHPQRPLACREYLVTSPAAYCAQPSGEQVRVLPLAGKPSRALMGLEASAAPGGQGWVALGLALEGVAELAEPAPVRPGTVWVEAFFQAKAGAHPPEVG